jgi:hypothetical protein
MGLECHVILNPMERGFSLIVVKEFSIRSNLILFLYEIYNKIFYEIISYGYDPMNQMAYEVIFYIGFYESMDPVSEDIKV